MTNKILIIIAIVGLTISCLVLYQKKLKQHDIDTLNAEVVEIKKYLDTVEYRLDVISKQGEKNNER